MSNNKNLDGDQEEDRTYKFTINSPDFHSKMLTANLVAVGLIGLLSLYKISNDTSSFLLEMAELTIVSILLIN